MTIREERLARLDGPGASLERLVFTDKTPAAAGMSARNTSVHGGSFGQPYSVISARKEDSALIRWAGRPA